MVKEELFNLALLSSEIKKPIGVALSAIELMEKKIMPIGDVYDKSMKDLFDISVSNIHRALRISYNFIDADRLTSKNFHLQISPQNLTHILKRILQTLERFLHFRGIKFDFICCVPDVLIVGVDENALYRILLNLISNSIKHLPEENGKIIVKLELVNGFVEISVIDNGSGITHDKMQYIFEPYWHDESENSRDKNSIGLGLYITKALVELHMGEIKVESEPYMQTTFRLQIPQSNYKIRDNEFHSTSIITQQEKFDELMKTELADCFDISL